MLDFTLQLKTLKKHEHFQIKQNATRKVCKKINHFYELKTISFQFLCINETKQ